MVADRSIQRTSFNYRSRTSYLLNPRFYPTGFSHPDIGFGDEQQDADPAVETRPA